MLRGKKWQWIGGAAVVLLILLLIYQIFIAPRRSSTFTTHLASVDTSKVTKIEIFPRKERQQKITLTRENSKWMVSNGKIKVLADQSSVAGVLSDHAKVVVDQLAGTSREHFREFDVDDSLGTRVKLYAGDELLLDVVVGKFSFSPQTRRAISYLRLYSDEKVYAIHGYMALWYNQKFNDYRNKKLFEGDKNTWDSLQFVFAQDTSYTLYKDTSGSKWFIRGYEAVSDSEKIVNYLNTVWGVRATSYIDTSLNIEQHEPYATLTIFSSPPLKWTVKCFLVPQQNDTLWVITTSLDSTNLFDGKKETKLYEQIFKPISNFFKKTEGAASDKTQEKKKK